ncbi:glycosyltransferase involved in cell wall biosynthesis [Rhizobium sp. PP-CC-2G-626]|nr:glycosyltransferase involved in cell wall biosynthesis [Rhizobium sp. PP-CC-2G-626]
MLDLEFYRKYNSFAAELTDAELKQHWDVTGSQSGLYGSPQDALRKLSATPLLPQNFDVFTYLELNKDVADASRWPFEGILHFLDYGQKENRRYSYTQSNAQEGEKASDGDDNCLKANVFTRIADSSNFTEPKFRLLNDNDRDSWMEAAVSLLGEKSVRRLQHVHPRGVILSSSFNIVSYLANNPDILEATDYDPFLALVHYLEFGIEEGRSGEQAQFNVDFISSFYDMELRTDCVVSEVIAVLKTDRPSKDGVYFLNEHEWTIYNKITEPDFIALFDHEYYRCRVPAAGFLGKNRWECIDHFWNVGRFSLIDISYEMRFDPEFYASEYYLDPAERMPSAREMFLAWLDGGIKKNYSPNLNAWMSHRVNVALPENFEALLRTYASSVGLLSQSLNEAATHMLTSGHDAILEIDINTHATGIFIAKVADRYALGGNTQLADKIYQNVLSAMPTLVKVLQHQSDQLERAGFVGTAVALRERAISQGSDDVWSYLTLSASYESLGQPIRAAETLKSAGEKFPGDVYIRTLRRTQARSLFQSLWDKAPSRALIRGYKNTQSEIVTQLDLCTERRHSPNNRSTSIKRVAIFASYDIAQCKLYRVNQKVHQLSHAGVSVDTFNYITESTAFTSRANSYDAVIFFRVPAFPAVIDVMTLVNDLGIPSFYDIDDLIFDEDMFPPPLSTYAGTISKLQHAEIACGVPLFRHAMSLCDFGIVSTATLAPLVAKHVRTGKVSVHPNGLGSEHYAALAKSRSKDAQSDVCRIFYGSGTKAHKSDFYDVLEPALVRVASEFGARVHIYLLGHFEWTHELKSVEENVTIMPPVWDVDLYWDILSRMDINLAILSESVANNAKSEIKWLEAAMFGIPSIVSRTETYAEAIDDGSTGFLCRTSDDFYKNLILLVSDQEVRNAVGAAAKEVSERKYGLSSLSRNLESILESSIVGKKKRLLVVNVFYPPQAIGGATRVVHDNVKDLLAKYGDEFEIDVVCTLEGGTIPYSYEVYSTEGVRVFAITAPSEPDIDSVPVHTKMGDVFSSLLNIIEPDMVHFHCIQRLTSSAVNVTQERKIPYVITVHDGWWISDKQFLLGQNDRIKLYKYQTAAEMVVGHSHTASPRAAHLRKALFGAHNVLSISDAFTAIYRQAGVPNLITISNGVPTVTALTKNPSKNGCVRLAHIGGMERHKGFHLVKYALMSSAFQNLELLVIDASLPSGVERTEIWGKTVVTFKGRTKQRYIGELYSTIDVLLAPSVWPEGFGLVSREALECGCWVVASDRGAVGADVVDGENGFIIDVATVGPLIEVLRKIDADVGKYGFSPVYRGALRRAADQADELAVLYRGILANSVH